MVRLAWESGKDNVGIADWCWTFTDKTPVELHGTSASHVFDTPGVYLVTLLVVDRAGNRATDTTSVMVRDKTPPVAEAGQDRVVTMGDEVAFDGSASADNLGIVGLIWTFTDGVPVALDGSNPSHRFNKPGVFVVTLNVTDAAGHWATDTLTVTVVDVTPPTAEAGSDQQVAAGTAVQLDGSLSTDNLGVSGFSWTFTYGSKAQRLEGRTVQFTFEEEGVYEIHLEVSDLSGNKGNDTVAITVVDIGSVTGTVLDQDGHPVEGALVELIVPNGTIRSATSGTDGSFALDVHHGSFVWRVSKDGYSTVSGNSSVAAMGARELDLPGMPLMKKAGEGPSGPDLIVPMALIIVVVVGLALVLLLRRRRGGGGA